MMQNKANLRFEQVLNDNKEKIYRICMVYALTPIEPADLFQEVIFQIWKSIPSFKDKSSINTWVYRITLNVCMRYKNKLEKHDWKRVRLDSIQFESSSIEADLAKEDKYKALYDCIKELNDADRSIVLLTLEELPYKEISKITGLSENHIAVKIRRMKKVLLGCINTKLK